MYSKNYSFALLKYADNYLVISLKTLNTNDCLMMEHFATHYQVIKATSSMKLTSLFSAMTNTIKIQCGYHHVEISIS